MSYSSWGHGTDAHECEGILDIFCQSFQSTLKYCFLPCHGSPLEGIMAMNNVEWTPENIKKAERICKETQQLVVIKNIDVSVPGGTSLLGLGVGGYGTLLGKARRRE